MDSKHKIWIILFLTDKRKRRGCMLVIYPIYPIVNSLIIKLWKKLKSRKARASPSPKSCKRMIWWSWISISEIGKIIEATKAQPKHKHSISKHWWMPSLVDLKMHLRNSNISSLSLLTIPNLIICWAPCIRKSVNSTKPSSISLWVRTSLLQTYKDGSKLQISHLS